jgi:hypothetical protein
LDEVLWVLDKEIFNFKIVISNTVMKYL